MFVALGIQNTIRVCRILWHVARTAQQYFPYYLIIGTIFEKKKILNAKYVFWFSLQRVSETFPILRRIRRNLIINVHVLM